MADGGVFREAALARIASPEQLDRSMVVTSARGWVALIGILVLLAAAGVWGFTGSIPTYVSSQGILIRAGGMQEVQSPVEGEIAEVLVHVGDVVEADTPIARIRQPELLRSIETAQAQLDEAQRKRSQTGKLGKRDKALRAKAIGQKARNVRRSAKAVKRRISRLQAREQSHRKLHAEGLITKRVLEATQAELQAARDEQGRLGDQLSELDIERQAVRSEHAIDSLSGEHAINELKRHVEELRARLRETSTLIGRSRGRVLEVRTGAGDQVRPGAPVVNLERIEGPGSELVAVVYAAARDGKRLRAGMTVHLSPSTVRREEHGYMEGEILSVATFPATREGMLRTLANEQLVDSFLVDGPPIPVRVRLNADAATPSGYRWTSAQGPPGTVDAGTLCAARILVKSQRPIGLVIPALAEEP